MSRLKKTYDHSPAEEAWFLEIISRGSEAGRRNERERGGGRAHHRERPAQRLRPAPDGREPPLRARGLADPRGEHAGGHLRPDERR